VSLDGIIGASATAELDGQGRTTLITDGLQWQLVRLPAGSALAPLTGSGISKVPGTTDKYEVTFNRPGPEGFYAVRWNVPLLGLFDESFQSYETVPQPLSFVPDTIDVAHILRARTKNDLGQELGDFTDATRPTGDEVTGLIGQAYDDVTSQIDTDLPQESYGAARNAIALAAALKVELSYWPEQIPNGQSPYNDLKDMFDEAMVRLSVGINRENEELVEGEVPDENMPAYNFDDANTIMERRW
jgi:hypothetical protein